LLLCAGIVFVSSCDRAPGENPKEQYVPTASLVIISPHNEDIRYEFNKAFERYYKTRYGGEVAIQWRDIGGGSSSILRYLQNVYERAETSGIDVLFGGGEYTFQRLAKQELLEPLQLSNDILDNIPKTFSGMEMVDPQMRWCGSVLSCFGLLYNIQVLEAIRRTPPQTWADLGKADYFGLIMLADPTQSGSVAAAYEMMVQSAPDWPSGWARLLAILSNANKFTDAAGGAANAPVIGESAIAACIDFYGTMRVAQSPDKLNFICPKGQTGFTPDPIGILKSPPNPKVAAAFVDFVLSLEGQSIWMLPPGHTNGPKRNYLNRSPIRKDVYSAYRDDEISAWIARPYADGAEMIVDAELRQVRYYVLIQLVRAAAIDNLAGLQKAKRKLIETNFPTDLTAEFNRLPDNADTIEKIKQMNDRLSDSAAAEKITADWIQFFRDKYRRIAE
jgi:ABC-type Fe3+ transport system substrate-binding protein